MVLFIDADIRLFSPCSITVGNNNSLRMDIRGSCAGGSVSLSTSDYNIMYYCIRYGDTRVMMNVRGEVNMKAWITDLHHPRPRLQGTCDMIKRERSRVTGQVLPALTEFAEIGQIETDLTRYCVLRYVASNWAGTSIRVTGGRTIDQFVGPLMELHTQLVDSSVIEAEEIITGDFHQPEDDDLHQGTTEAERLRLELQRSQQQQASRLLVSALPSSFLRVNANATSNRLRSTDTTMTEF